MRRLLDEREAFAARFAQVFLPDDLGEEASLAEPKGHMAELADGWMPEWVKVPT